MPNDHRDDVVRTLTVETFAELVGDRFALGVGPDATFELELLEANPLGTRPVAGGRRSQSCSGTGPR